MWVISLATSLVPQYCKCDAICLQMKFLSAIAHTKRLATRPLISGMCDAVVMTTLISQTPRPVGRKGYPSDQRSYAKLISKEEKYIQIPLYQPLHLLVMLYFACLVTVTIHFCLSITFPFLCSLFVRITCPFPNKCFWISHSEYLITPKDRIFQVNFVLS